MAKKSSSKPSQKTAGTPQVDMNNGTVSIVIDSKSSKVFNLPEGVCRKLQVERKVASELQLQTEDESTLDKIKCTVIVKGVPVIFTEMDLQEVFEMYGEVFSVYFTTLDTVNKTAEVLFEEPEGVDAVFSTLGGKSYVTGSAKLGLAKYRTEYVQSRPDFGALRTQVDTFMAAFDERSEKEKQSLRDKVATVDEDGFQYVTYKLDKKRKNHDEKDSVKRYNRKLNEKKNTVLAFYKFQEEEKKLEKTNQLKQKFEDDKKKLVQIKQSRSFKPY